MTIGFRSILVVNSEKKNNNLFWKSKFFGYVSFTGKSENLVETAILKDFFIFVANGHHFQKCSYLKEILSFLKEVSSVFEKCQFLVALFSFSKNNILCQKRQFLGK